jgi:single-strand DNA-binding protein
MNITLIQGRPTRDPELKESKKGKIYCRIRFADDGEYRGPDLPRKTNYFTVVAFGKQAQWAFNNCAKGMLTTVLGKLEQNEYIDRLGNKREEIVIIAMRIAAHEKLQRNRALKNLDMGNEEDLLVPREITDSLFRSIEYYDEDMPQLEGGDSIID